MVRPCTKRRRSGRPRCGFSLIEVSISTLLVGVLLTASMQTVGALIRKHASRADRDVALALAHQWLGEIQQSYFEDPDEVLRVFGPESGESTANRNDFDDLDDYDGWVETPPEDKDGTLQNDYIGYQRSVAIDYVDESDPTIVRAFPTDLIRITIDVTAPDGTQHSLIALRGRFSPYDVEPGVSTTYVRAVNVRIETQDASSPIDSGLGILNLVPVEDAP